MLKKVNFSVNDKLYVLGDTVDRGDDIWEFLMYIMSHSNVKLIKGNHEQMVIENSGLFGSVHKDFTSLTERENQSYRFWMLNGGKSTLKMLQEMDAKDIERILYLFRSAPLYKEVFIGEKRFILCHSGLGGYAPEKPLEQYSDRELLWYRPQLNQRFYIDDNTMVVFGHTPTIMMDDQNQGDPIISPTWINIDVGAALGNPFKPCLFCLNDYTWVKPD